MSEELDHLNFVLADTGCKPDVGLRSHDFQRHTLLRSTQLSTLSTQDVGRMSPERVSKLQFLEASGSYAETD